MASIISAGTTSGTALNMAGDTSGQLQLATNGSTTAVTIDTSQNVGIGTSSPASSLDVQAVDARSIIRLTATTGTNPVYSRASNTGGFLYLGRDGSGGTDFGAGAYAAGVWSTGAYPMVFGTNGTERMRINSSGDVGIGITTQDTRLVVSANTGTAVQRIFNLVGTNTYQMSFHNSSQECGTITTGNNTVGYNSNSDYRLKDNVIPMTGALDKIAKLKPVTYTWKASGTNGQGFIAHELQEHFPDAVSGEKDAVNEDGKPVYQGVDTSFLVATLTAAIQEQQTIINDLTARITALEGAA
jgi:hypothetical protein